MMAIRQSLGAIVATSMGMLNRLNDALRIPLESEFEALVA